MLLQKQKYLQIALNNTLHEAKNIINQIPLDKRIIIEVGTPLIKAYGKKGIKEIRYFWEQRFFGHTYASMNASHYLFNTEKNQFSTLDLLEKFSKIKQSHGKNFLKDKEIAITPYIIADLKCMDRGQREVEIANEGGANAATCLGQAPIETINAFIKQCEKFGLDSMIDMMAVPFPLKVLRQLKKLPSVVILHRGVDEESFNQEKEIPFHEIQRIKSNYDILIAIAGGDTFKETQRAIFNDADIVIVWKSFYSSTDETAKLAEKFLKEIR